MLYITRGWSFRPSWVDDFARKDGLWKICDFYHNPGFCRFGGRVTPSDRSNGKTDALYSKYESVEDRDRTGSSIFTFTCSSN